MVPAVALVSAASTNPPYTRKKHKSVSQSSPHLLVNQIKATYSEHGSADSGSSLSVARIVGHFGLSGECSVTDAVLVVEAAEGHLVQIV